MTSVPDLWVQGATTTNPYTGLPDDGDNHFMPNLFVRTTWAIPDWAGTQYHREGSPKTYARGGLVLVDKDDCPELVGRVYTRDPVTNKPLRIAGGMVLLRIYCGSPHPQLDVETEGWRGPNGLNNRPVQIDLRENDDYSGEVLFSIRRASANREVDESVRFHASETTGTNTPISITVNGAGGAVRRRVKFARVADLPANAKVLYIDP